MVIKQFSIRLDALTYDKLKVLADYECRFVNRQVAALIREAIEAYEEKYGEIICETE